MKNKSPLWSRFTVDWQVIAVFCLGVAMMLFSGGCETQKTPDFQAMPGVHAEHSEPLVLREGDVLKISFPGASSLDTVQEIRRDGKITLPGGGGEMDAVGKTTAQLEKDLIDHYASQLVSKEVTVSVQSSSFPIFVTGAVLRPGKVLADHPMTVLEAIMEAGGFDYSKANLKAVKIIREKSSEHYTLDFKGFLQGRGTESFYLKPFDIVYVPEKFSWF